MTRVVVSFSCGAASAVAAKIAVDAWSKSRDVRVVYCDLSADEHPDNMRFLADIERWIGREVEHLGNPKYSSIEDVFRQCRYIVGINGAACTKRLKRDVIDDYCTPGDVRVIGFTADEQDRIDAMVERHPDWNFAWVLAQGGIRKEDCYRILSQAGIELPAMYRIGYGHNNCIGCVKGGKGYWNKIRRDFPEVFASRAKVQREIGCAFRSGGVDFWLDELGPNEGIDQPDPDIECGVFCSLYESVLSNAVATAKGGAA